MPIKPLRFRRYLGSSSAKRVSPVLIWLLGLVLLTACSANPAKLTDTSATPQQRRQDLLEVTRDQAAAALTRTVPAAPSWLARLRLYRNGELLAQAQREAFSESAAIKDATLHLLTPTRQRPSADDLAQGRLLISLSGPNGETRVIDHQGQALEMAGDVIAVRSATNADMTAAIREQKAYLLRNYDRSYSAFFKLYDARNDTPENRLRTIYTASGLWTLLQMDDVEPDPRIKSLIGPMTEYLLSMQVSEGEHKGAFYYSYYPETQRKERRLVVGTASKTIFTLLDLYRRNGDARLLASARAAGDWLVTRVGPRGWVYPVVKWNDGKQRYWDIQHQSVLYSSQTLSALSRLAAVTGEAKYLEAASRIARRTVRLSKKSDFFVGDRYRPRNTISTSWVAMSLLDYHAASKDSKFLEAAFLSAHEVLKRQMRDPKVLVDYGRFSDTRTSSGNGWMNEVLVEVYRQCLANQRTDCDAFETALRLTSRWLLQNVYNAENSYQIPNPERARGGSIRGPVSGYGTRKTTSGDVTQVSVRTDAVCHGANSLIGVLQLLGTRAESSLPE